MAAAFRKMKLRDLLKYYIKWRSHSTKEDTEHEAEQLVCHWITWELWSRFFFSVVWRKIKEVLTRLYVDVNYKGLLTSCALLPKSTIKILLPEPEKEYVFL